MSELQRITEELVAELIKHKALLTEVLNNTSIQQLVKETHGAKDGNECNHRTAGLLPEPDGTLEIIEFDFCPKCGAEL